MMTHRSSFLKKLFLHSQLDREDSTIIKGDEPLVFAKDRRSLYSQVNASATGVSLIHELNQLKISANSRDCNYETFKLQSSAFYGNEWPS